MNITMPLDYNDRLLLRLFNVASVQFSYDLLDAPLCGPTAVIINRSGDAPDLTNDEQVTLSKWAANKFSVEAMCVYQNRQPS